MAYELLKKEIIGLSDDKLMQVIDFVRFLKQGRTITKASSVITAYQSEMIGKNSAENQAMQSLQKSQAQTTASGKLIKRQFGAMAGKITYIASDFDTCLEGMEDYM